MLSLTYSSLVSRTVIAVTALATAVIAVAVLVHALIVAVVRSPIGRKRDVLRSPTADVVYSCCCWQTMSDK